ncbi:MAG: mitofilin family membrane protein [Proteobacteria bacterium]|nr:mitofilin family membrane protein [Pseudomonadota bacterium]
MTNGKNDDDKDRTVSPRTVADSTAGNATAGGDSIRGDSPAPTASEDTVMGGDADAGVAAISLEEAGLRHHDEKRAGGEGGMSRALGALLIVVLTLVAAGAGAVLGPLVHGGKDEVPGLAAVEDRVAVLEAGVPDLSGVTDRLSALDAESDALEQRLTALENAPVATTTGDIATVDLSAITQRIGALEHGVGALAARVDGALDQKIDTIDTRIATLERSVSGAAGGDDGATGDATTSGGAGEAGAAVADQIQELRSSLAALSEKIEALSGETTAVADLRSQVGELGTQLSALTSATADLDTLRSDVATLSERATDPRAAFALAVGQLREDVLSGDAYADALATADSLAPDDAAAKSALATLQAWQGEGVATRARLADALGAAAFAAVDESRRDAAQGWFDQTVAELASIVSIRRTDGEAGGGSADDITARAEARLRQNDLSGAIAEMASLTGAAGDAAAGWLEMARAREAAEQAIDSLSARAIALVGGAAG